MNLWSTCRDLADAVSVEPGEPSVECRKEIAFLELRCEPSLAVQLLERLLRLINSDVNFVTDRIQMLDCCLNLAELFKGDHVSALLGPWSVGSEVGKKTKLIQNWNEASISRNFSLNRYLAQVDIRDVKETANTLNLLSVAAVLC